MRTVIQALVVSFLLAVAAEPLAAEEKLTGVTTQSKETALVVEVLKIDEGLDEPGVRSTLATRLATAKRCYQRSLSVGASFEARARLEIEVSRGKIKRMAFGPGASDTARRCIKRSLAKARFTGSGKVAANVSFVASESMSAGVSGGASLDLGPRAPASGGRAPGRGAVALGAPSMKKGKIDLGAVAAAVRERLPKLQQCYTRALAANRDLAGEVTVTFTLVDGMASKTMAGGMSDVGLVTCVAKTVEAITYPKGKATVTYPIRFSR